MSKITDEVYVYMCDEISGELNRAKSRMADVIEHLKYHPTPARFKRETAESVVQNIKQALNLLDELPVLPLEVKESL